MTTSVSAARTPSDSNVVLRGPRRRRWQDSSAGGVLLRLLTAIAILAFWELVVRAGLVDPFFVAAPSRIWERLREWTMDGTILRHTRVTVSEAAIGWGLGGLSGVLLGYATGSIRILDRLATPYVVALNAAPRLAVVPLLILWFGIGPRSIIALVFVVTFPIFFLNTNSGAKNIDHDLVTMARVLGASRLTLARRVVLPASLPSLFTGMRLALGYALAGAVVGEMIASRAGLGNLIASHGRLLDVAGVLAAVLCVVIIASIANILLGRIEGRQLRWRPDGRLARIGGDSA